MTEEQKIRTQRAVLMAIVSSIMMDELSTEVVELKMRTAASFGGMVKLGIMTFDDIEKDVVSEINKFIECQLAVEDAKDILKSE